MTLNIAPTSAHTSATKVIDCDHAEVIGYTQSHSSADATEVENAVSLYYAVRDDFRYDPYQIDIEPMGFMASTTLEKGYGWCVPKAVLLTACYRVLGIPARLGFADVRNHLTSEKLREEMQTDIFMWHGYTDVFLEGKWVKATPAFNIGLCEKANIHPLEFDGTKDSIYHEFDKAGNQHMEYVKHHGVFDDLPYDQILATFQQHYTSVLEESPTKGVFEDDVARENPS